MPAKLTPASVDDSWNAVEGDDLAHLFPASGGACLCGAYPAAAKGDRASCAKFDRPSDRVYRPYCGDCRDLQDARWGLVRVAPPPHLAVP